MVTLDTDKFTHLEEAERLFKEYEETNSDEAKSRAVQITENLCTSPLVPPDRKFIIFKMILKYEKELAIDILSRWRDGIRFLRGVEMDNTTQLLVKSIRCPLLSSHQRIYTCVYLYNIGFIHICYGCFAELAFDVSINIKHRLEAAKFLFGANDDDERETAQECLLDVISDHSLPSEFRYNAIAPYIFRRGGISTMMNAKKIKVPYDEDFVYSLQMPFFQDEKNDVRCRILSGQNLLQMKPDTISSSDKDDIVEELFIIAKNGKYTENTRADAADVVLRLGDSNQRAQARQLITELGFSADGKKRNLGIQTIYDNSQNIHNEEISKHVEKFLEKMLNENEYKPREYDEVRDEVSECIRNMSNVDASQRHAAFRALNRIGIDTATFTKYNATLSELLIHVWTHIHSGKFNDKAIDGLERRMLDELIDMSDTCSSGHAGRFVNVLSTVDDTLRISWGDQIRGNVSGRMNARIRDCKDKDIQASVALGMLEDADENDRKIYLDFIDKNLEELEDELRKEFVGEGYVREVDFKTYMTDIRNEWLKSEKEEDFTTAHLNSEDFEHLENGLAEE